MKKLAWIYIAIGASVPLWSPEKFAPTVALMILLIGFGAFIIYVENTLP